MSEAVTHTHTHIYRCSAYMHNNNRLCLDKSRKHAHIGRHWWAHMPHTHTLSRRYSYVLAAPQQQCKPLFSNRLCFASLRACIWARMCALLAYSNTVYCPIVLQPKHILLFLVYTIYIYSVDAVAARLLLLLLSVQFSYTFWFYGNNSDFLLECVSQTRASSICLIFQIVCVHVCVQHGKKRIHCGPPVTERTTN